MDVQGPSTQPGAIVHQWTCYGNPYTNNQRWQLRYTGKRHPGNNRYLYQWVNGYSLKCLEMPVSGVARQATCLPPVVGGLINLNARAQLFNLIPH